MSDWIKSFIVACLVFVCLILFGIGIAAIMLILMSIHFLIVPFIVISGMLTGLTIIIHGKARATGD